MSRLRLSFFPDWRPPDRHLRHLLDTAVHCFRAALELFSPSCTDALPSLSRCVPSFMAFVPVSRVVTPSAAAFMPVFNSPSLSESVFAPARVFRFHLPARRCRFQFARTVIQLIRTVIQIGRAIHQLLGGIQQFVQIPPSYRSAYQGHHPQSL